MKSCTKCLAEKPTCDFSSDARIKGGKAATCKQCKKVYVDQWKADNPGKMRGYRRASQKKSREIDNPLKVKARQAVADAIRSGKLTRPHNCEKCDAACVPHGHHKDYSKPLEIDWLCPECHRSEHHPPPDERYRRFRLTPFLET